MTMPGRKYSAGGGYRYGFNGKENDKDAGEGIQDYGMRIYDGRLGRFLSVDPLTIQYPWYSSYQFAGNMPIWATDLDGLEPDPATTDKSKKKPVLQASKNVYKAIISRKASCHSWNTDPNFWQSSYPNVTQFHFGYKSWENRDKNSKAYVRGIWLFFKSISAGSKRSYGGSEAADDYGQDQPGYKNIVDNIRDAKNTLNSGDSEKQWELFGSLTGGAFFGKVTSGTVITAIEEDGFAVVRDVSNVEVGRGSINNSGELSLVIRTSGTKLKGRGTDVLNSIFYYVNSNFSKINAIKGTWRNIDKYSDNLKTFNMLAKQGSLEDAALGTFTGKSAQKLGYKHAKVTPIGVKDANGNYSGVDVLFTK